MNHRIPANVPAIVLSQFPHLLSQQNDKGVRTYGTSLKTWNGRDAGVDALQELTDAFQYVMQLHLERNDLLNENADLRALLAQHGIEVQP